MSLSPQMPLATAKDYAGKIVAWLAPFCERIEIAGSIRRRRPQCADVDIVCIPIVTEALDLLGAVQSRSNRLLEFLQDYVQERNPSRSQHLKPYFVSGGEKEGKQCILELNKCQLDLWFATPETLATRLLCRTGSREHNIWIAERAKKLGGHWNPYEGLTLNGELVPARTELELYAALQLPFIPPERREVNWLNQNFGV